MGIQSLQEFVDGSPEKYTVKLPKVRSTPRVLEDGSNTYLVHGDSCIHLFYQYAHMDWICGGQWNEFVNNVEKFVRGFRQCNADVVVFIDGTVNSTKLYEWRIKHRLVRENAKEALEHVLHKQQIPVKSRQEKFVAPGALKAALRLAFRSCNVTVCNAVNDVFQESILFCKDLQLQGIIAKDANYLLYAAPRYLTFSMNKLGKRTLESLSLYKFKEILESLRIPAEKLSIYGSLLGNRFLSEKDLAAFFWDLIDESSPLRKAKENLQIDVVLPPPSLRLKCIAEFLCDSGSDLDDIAQKVFAHSKTLSLEKGKDLLRASVDYYAEGIKASKSARVLAKDKESRALSGYPVPEAVLKFTERKRAEQEKLSVGLLSDRRTQCSPAGVQPAAEEMPDPEKVLKEGTLEEAAKALEVLEQKESAAVLKEAQVAVNSLCDKTDQITSEGYVLISKEDEGCLSPKENGTTDDAGEKSVSEDAIKHSESVFTEEEQSGFYPREITIQSCVEGIPAEILNVALKRHQSGQMCPEILHLLSKGEIVMDMALEDELSSVAPPIALIYRPLRQLTYGVLFSHKVPKTERRTTSTSMNPLEDGGSACESVVVEAETVKLEDLAGSEESSIGAEDVANSGFAVKEWCVYVDQDLCKPDSVAPVALSWGIPSLQKLWLGLDPEDNANRLKAFLSCMKSDTVNMSNTAMVPQRLLLLCCTLRYLIQHGSGKSLLSRQEIDAFIAQALSPFLTTENNVQNLANFKVGQVDSRGVQLAAIFMSGIENAIMANDACGSPVPWEFCCPWNFFDGKVFQSKWLQSLANVSTMELCDGKPQLAAKLERIRWCITEGLDVKYAISGLQSCAKGFNPFGNPPPSVQAGPLYARLRPADASAGSHTARSRSRGPGSKRLVHGSGGTLQVAGVPVAHWGGNKSGLGYSKNAPDVVVGGPGSVDLPSSHRRGKRGERVMIKGSNRGRGLLETPYFSSWVAAGFGLDGMVASTYHNYMRGVQKAELGRPQASQGKVRGSVPGNTNARRPLHQQQHQFQPPLMNGNATPVPAPVGSNGPKQSDMWMGAGRSQPKPAIHTEKIASTEDFVGRGRGKWLNDN